LLGEHKQTRIWVSTTSHDQDDKKQTVFKSYKQMKNLQHTQSIATIVSMEAEKCTIHPKLSLLTIPSLIDVCGSNCRTLNFPSLRTPPNLLLVKNNRLLLFIFLSARSCLIGSICNTLLLSTETLDCLNHKIHHTLCRHCLARKFLLPCRFLNKSKCVHS